MEGRCAPLPSSPTYQPTGPFFCTGYPVRPEQIQFVFRNDGRLTGEAFVTFAGGAGTFVYVVWQETTGASCRWYPVIQQPTNPSSKDER